MTYALSSKSLKRLEGVDDDIVEAIKESVAICPIDFGIPKYGGLRTAEVQKVLYSKGASRCDGVIKLSEHQTGHAFDVYAYVDGAASWEIKYLGVIAATLIQVFAKRGIPLEWGGLFKPYADHKGVACGWDAGHFQKGSNL
mgnify:CR=1 FL=1